MYLLVLPGPKSGLITIFIEILTIPALTNPSITNQENKTDLEVVKDIRNSKFFKSTIFGQKTLDFRQEILKEKSLKKPLVFFKSMICDQENQ